MSKAKDRYYELKKYLGNYPGNIDSDVLNYVTELEQKAEMWDEMVNLLSYSATVTRCFPDVMLKDLTEDLKSILERVKKIEEALK